MTLQHVIYPNIFSRKILCLQISVIIPGKAESMRVKNDVYMITFIIVWCLFWIGFFDQNQKNIQKTCPSISRIFQ